MAWVESLQKAIDYIEDNLLHELTIEEISKQANSSVFHFQRTFSILTDINIAEYIRRRRLTLAANELTTTDLKIIDIALKYGYDSPESFSKAFRRQHGVTPSEARKFIGKLKSYNRLVIQVSLKGAEPMQFNIVEKSAFQVVGVKKEFSFLNDQQQQLIPKMWEEVNSNGTSDRLYELNNGDIKGVLGVCMMNEEQKSKNLLEYWVAAVHEGETPEGFDHHEISASKWAVFGVHGAMPTAMQDAWKKIFSEWFPSSGYSHAGIPEFELYPEGNPFSEDYYSEIWIPVK
ncbi:AraC family transcriptional regulator [Bacillus sp. AFS002410]|uniref:AraC family transcriptional regulator n=1 Tax=Bacillus sp. AFS002410 TaxID=2033481 RepID=UPI000BF0371A|nr:AraC family transcriptional regulator [Bacillus sp. AFS002410]PEJ52112.1 AraC family transcriptional regulator [Bacillus sp. AFS002410]